MKRLFGISLLILLVIIFSGYYIEPLKANSVQTVTSADVTEIDLERKMSIHQADIRDIIYSYARAQNLDIYLFEDVSGRASLQISGMEGKELLENIILASGFAYFEVNEVIYVGKEDNITRLKSRVLAEELQPQEKLQMKIIEVDWRANRSQLLLRFFPELEIDYWEEEALLLLIGPEDKVAGAEKMVENLKINLEQSKTEPNLSGDTEDSFKREYLYVQSNLQQQELDQVLQRKGISFTYHSPSGQLIIEGEAELVAQTVLLIEGKGNSLFHSRRIIELDYQTAEEIIILLQPLYPEVFLQALAANRLHISGISHELEEISALFQHLDQIPAQILVEFEVLEITEHDRYENNAFNSLPSLEVGLSFPLKAEVSLNWQQYLSAMREKGKLKVLAAPRLVSLAGHPARLHIGERIPLPVYDQEGRKTGYDYLDSGIILNLKAELTSRDEILLALKPEVSTASHYNSSVPQFNTRELETKIRLRCGETYYIGGLFQEYDQQITSSVPFLENIPLLGELFSRKQLISRNSEIIISITPHLLDN